VGWWGITIASAGEEMVQDRLGPYTNASNRLERCGKSGLRKEAEQSPTFPFGVY
jgi:hypothetical protein